MSKNVFATILSILSVLTSASETTTISFQNIVHNLCLNLFYFITFYSLNAN